VDLNSSAKFRKLTPGRCRYCDRQFFYRQVGRPKLYCDHKCRQADFRHAGYPYPKRDESPRNSSTNSSTTKADFGDRPLPLNLFGGGYRWPGAAPIDRQLLRQVIEKEIGGKRHEFFERTGRRCSTQSPRQKAKLKRRLRFQ
jgi:hypothetical protein